MVSSFIWLQYAVRGRLPNAPGSLDQLDRTPVYLIGLWLAMASATPRMFMRAMSSVQMLPHAHAAKQEAYVVAFMSCSARKTFYLERSLYFARKCGRFPRSRSRSSRALPPKLS